MLLETMYKFLKPNQAEKVLLYIFEHLDRDGVFSRTYVQIQKDTGVSQPTIARVFESLEKIGAAKHISKSQWSLAAAIDKWTNEMDDFRGFYVEAKGK